MDYILLQKLLMEWSLNNSEYELSNFLFFELNIGIPIKYLYKLPTKNSFSSICSFLEDQNNIKSNDYYLSNILNSFRYSKLFRLEEWNNEYGYRFKF